MEWDVLSWYCVGTIVKICNKMDQHLYKNILKETMLPFADENLLLKWTFMHDNNPKHTARILKQLIIEEKFTVLSWPAQSPDLNPIENLWNDVETHVKERKKNQKIFVNYGRWCEIAGIRFPLRDINHCSALAESLLRRLVAVLRQKTYPTKY